MIANSTDRSSRHLPQHIGNVLFVHESDRIPGSTVLEGEWEFESRYFIFCVANPQGSTVPARWSLYEGERTIMTYGEMANYRDNAHVTACFLAEVTRAARRLI